MKESIQNIKSLKELAKLADYSLMNTLNQDPKSSGDGDEFYPREVFSGHYVAVKPTPIENPEYISHSKELFCELGFDDKLATDEEFIKMFSADCEDLPKPLSKVGWACGYALSIYGREYYNQCPFGTGNAYGDGRAISILEMTSKNKRWEMQLKGGGRTPYCRGADGRAVLRSSIREFLAQEHMNALGIATSRSLSLYTSKTEKVQRPWYSKDSLSWDPDIMVSENVAISTRVAPSFIRVGQVELFARRARKNEYKDVKKELEMLVLHLIAREYSDVIDENLSLNEKIILLAKEFRSRLTELVVSWIRVGFCQGNFNSDNTAVGGFTLDYGPFGFMEMFDPQYQSWTGGGRHFAFFNQIQAAHKNYAMFYKSLQELLVGCKKELLELDRLNNHFSALIHEKMQKMWADKLGLRIFDNDLFSQLQILMLQTGVDYTIFFRELSHIPKDIKTLKKSFYKDIDENQEEAWNLWFDSWKSLIKDEDLEELSLKMKEVNPKYILREWILVDAYEKAKEGDYSLVKELQEVMNNPYDEQTKEIEDKYYKLKAKEFFDMGGISHVSCSS